MPINNSFDEERFVAVLEEAINKVKTEEDPVLLTDMKKLFKKHVPFTLRTYVAAYLAKQACQGFKGGSKYSSRTEGFTKGNDRGARKERPAPQRRHEEVRRESNATSPWNLSISLVISTWVPVKLVGTSSRATSLLIPPTVLPTVVPSYSAA